MKLRFLILILIGLILTSCNPFSNLWDSEPDKEEKSEQYLMTINLVSTNIQNSREGESLDYENGTDAENAITDIRFYFFDNKNNIIKTRTPKTGNAFNAYFDHTYTQSDNNTSTSQGNVEKEISILLNVEFEENNLPSKLIAIVNPWSGLNNVEITDLSALQGIVEDFQTGLTTSGTFVMSNSVYLDNSTNGNIICPVDLYENQICKTEEEARKYPIDVYVERVVARLDVSFSSALTQITIAGIGKVFDTGFTFKPEDNSSMNQKIYLKFLGWAVTSTPSVSRLLKSINPGWNNLFSATEHWNSKDLHRSLWALNPDFSSLESTKSEQEYFKWYSYNDLMPDREKEGVMQVNVDEKTVNYMQENANPYSTDESAANPIYNTKVIFSAKLIDEEGKAVTIAEYGRKYYTLDGLKKMVADMLDLYYENGNENGNIKYQKIQPDDLELKTLKETTNQSGPSSEGSYYVYFKIKDNSKKWYQLHKEVQENPSEIANPDEYIGDMTYPVKVWNEGRTYYYFDIPHAKTLTSKDSPGYYGVVRNHIYNATIEQISTLGTPVYNPDEVIYPETPENDGTQLVVSVNTLLWRLVKKNIQFVW